MISLIKIHIDSVSLLLKHFLLTVFCIDINSYWLLFNFIYPGGSRGCDRMVVGFTTTYAIGAYRHWCGFDSNSGRCVQHYVIKFVNDLQQVSGFLWFPPSIKLITMNTIKPTIIYSVGNKTWVFCWVNIIQLQSFVEMNLSFYWPVK